MTINDIIGKGKAFEPPFFTDPYGSYIFDNNHQMMLETRGFGHLRYLFSEVEVANLYPILARHICDLLNREHYKKGGE